MKVYTNQALSDSKVGMTGLTVTKGLYVYFVFPCSCKVPRLRVRPSVLSQAGGLGLYLCMVTWLSWLTVLRSFLHPPCVHEDKGDSGKGSCIHREGS